MEYAGKPAEQRGNGEIVMKLTIDIDCTPEEARAFFGLPDLGKAHQAAMDAMAARMRDAVGEVDAEALLKGWLPGGVKSMEELGKNFWAGFSGFGAAKESKATEQKATEPKATEPKD
jgi:hypothetical protein